MRTTVNWNIPGIQEALGKALADGCTASEAARRLSAIFGLKFTRNSVIGRQHRTNLKFKRAQNHQLDDDQFAERRAREKAEAQARMARRRAEMKTLHDWKEAAKVEPIPLGDVDRGCRWPHGEATQRNFCGAETISGRSWCAHHMTRVYVGGTAYRPKLGLVAKIEDVT